jgi:hypothetical protein
MRWLLSLTLGLLIAWIIVLYVNKMRRTSYFYKADSVQPAPLEQVDSSLVAVGLAQYPQVPSIMDSVNQPTPAPRRQPPPRQDRPRGPGGDMDKPMKLPQRGPPPSQGPAPMTPTSTPMSPVPTNSPSFSPTPIPGPTPKPPTTTPVGASPSSSGGPAPIPSGTPVTTPSAPAPSGPAPAPYGMGSSGAPIAPTPNPGSGGGSNN